MRGLELQAPSEQRPHKLSLQAAGGAASDAAAFGSAVAELHLALERTGARHKVVVSSGRDVDILPPQADKGAALRCLLAELAEAEEAARARGAGAGAGAGARDPRARRSSCDDGAAGAPPPDARAAVAERTLVAGDSGNDTLLLAVAGVRAVAVGNAQQELLCWCEAHQSARVYRAKAHAADGILEAMRHFGFLLPSATAPDGA